MSERSFFSNPRLHAHHTGRRHCSQLRVRLLRIASDVPRLRWGSWGTTIFGRTPPALGIVGSTKFGNPPPPNQCPAGYLAEDSGPDCNSSLPPPAHSAILEHRGHVTLAAHHGSIAHGYLHHTGFPPCFRGAFLRLVSAMVPSLQAKCSLW